MHNLENIEDFRIGYTEKHQMYTIEYQIDAHYWYDLFEDPSKQTLEVILQSLKKLVNPDVNKVFDIDVYYSKYKECNVIACPICQDEYARTNIKHKLSKEDKSITCTECNTSFKLISDNWYSEDTKVVVINTL